MDTVSVRDAVPGDIAAIADIYADAVVNGTSSYELVPPDIMEMTRRYEALIAGGHPYLVAEHAGRVVGYAYAGAFRPRPAYRFAVENSVYLAPDAKGLGIGRLLMERLIAEATRRGFRQMIAVIGDGHAASASVILHAKLGFRDAGRLHGTGFKHGRWLDTAFMQLALGEGAGTLPPAV